MLTVKPDYYNNFKCIAEKCKHNCCVGWEIEIDENTYVKYKSLTGPLQDKLQRCIAPNDNGGTFILNDEERCPFLDETGLCEIIKKYGYDYLSDICKEHPRFINIFSDRIEMGIGLCCEAAAELILKSENITKFYEEGSSLENDEEIEFFKIRQNVLNIMQNRTISIIERKKQIIKILQLNHNIDKLSIINFMESLEILDNKWLDFLQLYIKNVVKIRDISLYESYEIIYEQLFVYFLYRHLAESVYDGRFSERLLFCIISCDIIFDLCSLRKIINGDINSNDFVDIARMYSAEIEYSEDNTESLIKYLSAVAF